jgi:hypothetical protein
VVETTGTPNRKASRILMRVPLRAGVLRGDLADRTHDGQARPPSQRFKGLRRLDADDPAFDLSARAKKQREDRVR